MEHDFNWTLESGMGKAQPYRDTRRVAARGTEIIHEMDDEVRAATLPGEAEMFRIKLVPIEAEAEFHARKI